MGIFASIKTWFVLHLLMGYIFILSGLIVNCIMFCTLIIWPFSKTIYRKVNCYLAYWIWSQYTFLGQWWSGSDIVLKTNPEDVKYYGKEHAIIILNHKYDIDWLLGYFLAERLGILGGSKVYGKEMLKFVPIQGWSWYFTESVFLKRNWEQDRKIIIRDIKNLAEFPVNYWILMFCEGTRFTEAKHKASMKVAKEKGLPELKHHLLPRTKGFVLTMQGLKGKIPAIYDCTVGITKSENEPTFMNVVNGKTFKAELKVRRITLEEIPTDTDEECSAWLHKLYQEKDEFYDGFLKKGHFDGALIEIPKRPWDLLVWLFWAVTLGVPLIYYLIQVLWSGSIYVSGCVVLVIVFGSVMVRWMIAVTETERGSKYGHRHEEKKEQ
ncbi:1-acyl-sn-glycerol-3-phosphate acyltransferase delta isoform X2 [Lingula anatina]|uniref:1-acyl-sn-glycerol-3-phosphate acyltransferase delta isoform X2 n=1 Tax=Lingula anatina TaxID=7574 RepID=A0A1S3H928_LINAN|nr:1-acyl-sn-glycerol-3-phosphate acyltransferase delta isoform X2 [Lingula anatina]|eukprot:XP_013381629.1 1-acyl-sn-glycerol-3-phosphate acyltransferase delta isoform X2 [Lingula anatina]